LIIFISPPILADLLPVFLLILKLLSNVPNPLEQLGIEQFFEHDINKNEL